MEEYKNIMKLVDSKLAEQESVIEYYRKKQDEWEEQKNSLENTNCSLKAEIEELLSGIECKEYEIKQLREKIAEYEANKEEI